MIVGNTSRVSRIVVKRRISVSVAPLMGGTGVSTASFTEQKDRASPKSTKLTVSQFLAGAQKCYTPRYSQGGYPPKTVELTEVQAVKGSELRALIQENDGQSLNNLIGEMYTTGDWTHITEGLTRPEVSLLLRSLVEAHGSQIRLANHLKNLVPREHKTQFRDALVLERNINHLYSKLIQIKHPLTTSDVELLLKYETDNLNFKAAQRIVEYGEAHGANTVNFHNLKMRALGHTSPEAWISKTGSQLTIKGRKLPVEPREVFSKLLQEFSSHSNEFIPNLESHKQILCGFAHSRDLIQVRIHLEQIWGIPADESMPIELVSNTSSLYPDQDLLCKIVQMFGYNNHSLEGLNYVLKFIHYYQMDMARSTQLWSILVSFLKQETRGDSETISQRFLVVWDDMVSNRVRISDQLYRLKCDILSNASKQELLLSDLDTIRRRCLTTSSKVMQFRMQKVLTHYLKAVALFIYKGTDDVEEADRLTNVYFEHYSVSAQQLSDLQDCIPDIKELVESQRMKFEELQRQYDEEDDEESLW